jgi:opacity protein-like surface antigen
MRNRPIAVLVVAAVLVVLASAAQAQDRWRVDFENGAAISGYNNLRIPGDTGTTFSLTRDLASDTAYFWRLRVDLRLGRKHVVSALVAPLRINASGRFSSPVEFAGGMFAAGVPVNGLYVFNSYRVTYRYEPVRNQNWIVGVGLSVKVRDAVTRLESGGTSAEKANVGVVPLINFTLERRLGARVSLLLEGDALAAPQGRAEDVFAGILLRAGDRLSFKAGYRFLEGGADNDEVYTFALVHYVAAGVVIRF